MTKYGKKRSFKVENLLFYCQLKNIPIFEPYDETKNTFELFHQKKIFESFVQEIIFQIKNVCERFDQKSIFESFVKKTFLLF